jgi:hypothetical protein
MTLTIPDEFTIKTVVGLETSLDANLTTNLNLAGGVSLTVLGDAEKPIAAKIDASVDMKNLPHFTVPDLLSLIKEVKRLDIRACFPVNFKFGISVFPLNLFGVDAVQFSVCGEPQVILQPYVPNAYERCEVECEPHSGGC